MPKKIIKVAKKELNNKKLVYSNFCYDFDEALKNSDCVMTDTWISMGEKKSKSKIKLLQKFQVNDMIMKKTKKHKTQYGSLLKPLSFALEKLS